MTKLTPHLSLVTEQPMAGFDNDLEEAIATLAAFMLVHRPKLEGYRAADIRHQLMIADAMQQTGLALVELTRVLEEWENRRA